MPAFVRYSAKLTVETGVGYFSYPGSPIDISYPEYYIAPSYALTPKLTVGAEHVLRARLQPHRRLGELQLGRRQIHIRFGPVGFRRARPPEFQHHQSDGALAAAVKLPDYTYWNFGFAYTYKVLTFDLRYFATTLSKQDCNLITGTAPLGRGIERLHPAIIGTLSWSANLSGLK